MKKKLVSLALCLFLICSFSFGQKAAVIFKPYTGSNFNQQKKFYSHQGLKEGLSEKWDDSIYTYYWKTNIEGWWLGTKEYLTPSPYNFVGTELFRNLDTVTQRWSNTWNNTYQYFGSTSDVQEATYKLWDPVNNTWIQYSYDHYYLPNKADAYFYKTWDPIKRKFTYGYNDTCQYNSNGNPVDERGQYLDTVSSLFVNTYRFTFSYNNASKLLEQISMGWDTTTSAWAANSKKDIIYDSVNMLIETQQYYWYQTSWLEAYRSFYTNNTAGFPIHRIDLAFNGLKWDTSGMATYTYNPSDTLLVNQLEWSYDSVTKTWTNKSNLTNTYFSSGKMKTSLGQIWNPVTSQWMNSQYNEYDSLGNSTDYYYINIDFSTFQTYSGFRVTNVYDDKNRFIQTTKQNLNTSTGDWDNVSKCVTSYESSESSNPILNFYSKWNGTSWVNDYEDVFYWSYPSGFANLKSKERPCFYENPLQEGTLINCPFLDPSKSYQFELFSLGSGIVLSLPINHGDTFMINRSLSTGSYILLISENGKPVYRDKVVVIKYD